MTRLQKERLERYKKRLEMYYEAEEAVLLNQEYTIGTKSLKRADLSTIRAAIKDMEGKRWNQTAEKIRLAVFFHATFKAVKHEYF